MLLKNTLKSREQNRTENEEKKQLTEMKSRIIWSPLNSSDDKCQTRAQSAQEVNGFLSRGLGEIFKKIRNRMRESYTTEDLSTAVKKY